MLEFIYTTPPVQMNVMQLRRSIQMILTMWGYVVRTMVVIVTAPHYHKVRDNWATCADPESFVKGGPTLTGFFFRFFCFVFS